MDLRQAEHLRNLKQIHQKRAEVLEEQAAKLGTLAPPHILIELEELRGKIGEVERKLSEDEHGVPSVDNQGKQIKILFMTADPTNLTRLRLGQEAREIREKLQLSRYRERFVLAERWSVRPQDITQAILDEQPNLVHFSGHGSDRGELCFEDANGDLHPISPSALSSLFRLVADNVRCVLLNACYSEIQAEAISEHIEFVIGMQEEVGDEAAIAFAVGFYKALAGGRDIVDAFEFGRVELELMGISEYSIPILVSHSTGQ